MENREYYVKRAENYFAKGLNCAQAVLCAFHELCRLTEEECKVVALGFGGGMGRMREVCGTVSGGILVLNYMYGGETDKAAHYEKVQYLMKTFEKENGSYLCKTLLGLPGAQPPVPEPRTAEYYKKRPCGELCGISAGIVYDILCAGREKQ